MKKLPFLLLLTSVATLSVIGRQVTPSNPIVEKVTLHGIQERLERKKPNSRSKRPFFAAELDAKLILSSSTEKTRLFIEQAQVYRKAGFEGSLDRSLRRALDASEGSPETMVTVTNLLTGLGDVNHCQHAVTLNTSYINLHPNIDSAYASRAKSKKCLGDFLGAFDDLSRALEMKPDDFYYLLDRLNIPSRISDTSKAFELLQIVIDGNMKAAANHPSGNLSITYKSLLASSYISRSIVYKKIGDQDKQLADLTSAVAIYPDSSLRTRASQYWEYKMFDLAIADLTHYIQLQEKRYGPNFQRDVWPEYVFRARLYADAGRNADAINDYVKAIELNPENRQRLEGQILLLKQKP